jgi:hypothetical protein
MKTRLLRVLIALFICLTLYYQHQAVKARLALEDFKLKHVCVELEHASSY